MSVELQKLIDRRGTAMKFNQKGFRSIKILLAIIVAILVIGIGLYAYSVLKNTSVASSNSAAPAKNNVTAYVKVPEWGIRLPLPNNFKDIYIANKTLSAHRLDAVDACAANKTGIATLQRYKDGQPYESQAGDTVTQDDIANAPLINGYRYLVASGNGACTDTSNQTWQAAHKAILDLTKSIQAIPS